MLSIWVIYRNLEIFNIHNRPLELLELSPTNFAHRHTP
jgi:hypothetical protein